MSVWQECPVCNGTGKDRKQLTPNEKSADCNVCEGAGIISQATGKPPQNESDNGEDGSDKEFLKD